MQSDYILHRNCDKTVLEPLCTRSKDPLLKN